MALAAFKAAKVSACHALEAANETQNRKLSNVQTKVKGASCHCALVQSSYNQYDAFGPFGASGYTGALALMQTFPSLCKMYN